MWVLCSACMLDDQIYFPLIASLSLAAAGCLLVEQKVDCDGECLSHPETKPQAHWAAHLLKQNNKNSSKKQAIAYSATNFVINPSFQPNKFSVKVWWTQRRKLESSPLRERWEGWAWWSWSLSSCSSRRRSRAGRLCHLSPPDQTLSTSRTKMLSYTVIVRCNLPGEQSCLSWELWAGGKAVRYLVPNEEIIKGR